MDLSVVLLGTRLNIRSTVLLETPAGYVFEHDKNGFYYPVGGRVKLNETSAAAAARELDEELGLICNPEELQYLGVVEDFYTYDNIDYHELNFVFLLQQDSEELLPKGFCSFYVSEIIGCDIRPAELKKIILSADPVFGQMIIKDHRSAKAC